MHALSAAAAAITSLTAAVTHRRGGSTGGVMEDGGAEADGRARVHLLADTRDEAVVVAMPQFNTACTAELYGGFVSIEAAAAALQGSVGLQLPLGETLRNARVQLVSATAAVGAMEGGKKLS